MRRLATGKDASAQDGRKRPYRSTSHQNANASPPTMAATMPFAAHSCHQGAGGSFSCWYGTNGCFRIRPHIAAVEVHLAEDRLPLVDELASQQGVQFIRLRRGRGGAVEVDRNVEAALFVVEQRDDCKGSVGEQPRPSSGSSWSGV